MNIHFAARRRGSGSCWTFLRRLLPIGLLAGPLAVAQELTIADLEVDEASGMAELTVSLSQTGTASVSVDWETVDGTAVGGLRFHRVGGYPDHPGGNGVRHLERADH